jgi:two-component system chemotaxis response regulator CheY
MTLVIPAPAPCGSDFSGCKALIVDPWVSNRRLLRETLRDLGCMWTQDTGLVSDAWTQLRRGGVNVLFLDWSGDTDAVAFLQRLRNPENPDRFVPVVVMTAYAGPEHVITMRDVGATEFMLRPFSNEVVASRLRSIVHSPRLFIEGGPFFGPDRRRRRLDWRAPERRNHENWRSGDRRRVAGDPWSGPERRQGRPGYEPLERRNAPRA